MQKAEDDGLDGFLIKPVNASVLFDAIMQAFGEKIPETSRLTRRRKEADALQGIRVSSLRLHPGAGFHRLQKIICPA
jgi:FixJ family two-component response regulator